jgi:hypothetical protein
MLRRILPLTAGALVVAACATSRAELEPRYVAVHNALSAMGMAQVGPIHQGSLFEGNEAKITFDLTAQCSTIVAIGADGVKDLDVTLLDPSGKPVAHDTTREPQAVVRACVDAAGTYTLVVKMARGAGSFVAGTWSGGIGGSGGPTGPAAIAQQGAGTCESPIPLTPGTINGTTGRGESENEGSCGRSDSKEIVYRFEVTERQRVTFDVHPRFDAVLYVRKDECGETSSEVGCNDDAPNQDRSKLDLVMEPGTYFVFVDGYNHEAGQFRMTVTTSEVPSTQDVCRRARPLLASQPITGQTTGAFDHANTSCGNGGKGVDTPYKLDLATRSRVRVTHHSDDFPPVVHLRRACADEHSEVACADTGLGSEEATFNGVLDPGSYAVFADAKEADGSGKYTILAETASEQGGGAPGDGCGDAVLIAPGERTVNGDTFSARDDVAGKCGGTGAPDVIYRLELPRRSRVSVKMDDDESQHVFLLTRTCGDRSGEIACARAIDETVAPGVYFLAVDGATAPSFGKFVMDVGVTDVGAQETACRAPPLLVDGQTVNASTQGAGDKFHPSCASRDDSPGSGDRVFKIVLAQRARVRLSLTTATWDGVLALRRSCLDGGARSSEVACNNDAQDGHHSKIEQLVDAGTYYVLVDGHRAGNEGSFSLEYKVLK